MDISIADIIKTLIHASILSTVFALGLKATIEDIAYLTQRPWLLLRSILAMYLITPLIAVLLVFVFDAPVPVEIAVLLMAISAGAPALPKKLLVLGTNPLYVYSLAVIMAVLAMVTVPASLFLLSAIFPQDATLAPVEVATTIGTKFLAPLVVGMVVRRFPAFNRPAAIRTADQRRRHCAAGGRCIGCRDPLLCHYRDRLDRVRTDRTCGSRFIRRRAFPWWAGSE